MKKWFVFVFILLLAVPAQSFAAVSDVTTKDILAIYDEVTEAELLQQISETAAKLNISEEEVTKQIYEELSYQAKLSKLEESATLSKKSGDFTTMSTDKGNGTYTLGSSSKGDIFYETASTAGIQHGHVGIYYSSSTLVESLPSTGVRSLARTNKLVDPGARIQAVYSNYASSTQKSNAANWAYGRIGENYSYNFFNNRSTSCIGDKNCSKLVWCAYLQTVGIDLDGNGGLGVYPKDIRDSSLVYTITYY